MRKKKLQYISMFLRLVGKKRPSGPSGISKDNVYWAPVLKKNLSHAESAQLRELMAGEGKQAPRLVSHQNLIKISMSLEMCSLMRWVLLAQEEREYKGRRGRDISPPTHSKLAKFTPAFAKGKN